MIRKTFRLLREKSLCHLMTETNDDHTQVIPIITKRSTVNIRFFAVDFVVRSAAGACGWTLEIKIT